MIRSITIPWGEAEYARSRLHALGLQGAAFEASKKLTPQAQSQAALASMHADARTNAVHEANTASINDVHQGLRQNQVALFQGKHVNAYAEVYDQNPGDPWLYPVAKRTDKTPVRIISDVPKAAELWRVDARSIADVDTRETLFANNRRQQFPLH